MKNIFKYIIPCIAVALAFASCDSTMDDKAAIDAKYLTGTTTTAAVSSVTAVDYQTVSASGAVSTTADVTEVGIQLSTAADFSSNVISVASDAVESTFSAAASGLAELTTYYVRAYAVTRGGGIVVSEAQTATTPKTPIFPLDGTYNVVEYDLNDDDEWEAADQYEITVAFDEEDPSIVSITNIWGGGMTVQGQYNEKTGIVTVPNYQVIYVHASYGDVWLRGVAADLSGYTSDVKFQFTKIGGKMESTTFAAQCSAGNFAFMYLSMEHQ